MALTIAVRLRHERYDAALHRASRQEWPPHPARVFCALVASAVDDADWAALSWLEGQGEPEVWAGSAVATSHAVGYVVTNAVEQKGGSQFWPGRSNGYKARVSTLPDDPAFAIVWPDAVPDDAVLGRLVRLARRVPYVGRSTSPAEVTVVPDTVEIRPAWSVHRPAALGTAGSHEMRVPYPGYVARLREAYDDGRRPHDAHRAVAYLRVSDAPAVPERPVPTAGPFPELLVFAVVPPSVPVSGDRVLTVTEALRQATISRVADPVPAAVSGHGDDDRHVAYLTLPHVGHPHADGHVLGVALACPRMADGDRRALLRGLLDDRDPFTRLRIGPGMALDLEYVRGRSPSWGLRAERWTAAPTGSYRWVTVTPIMLDKHPNRRLTEPDLVAQALVTAGFPEPVGVEVLPGTPVRGAVFRPRRGSLPQGRPRRAMVHCRVEFAVPVVGPVVAGSLRYRGCGLLVPERRRDADGD